MILPSDLKLAHLPGQKDPLLALVEGEEQFYLNPQRLEMARGQEVAKGRDLAQRQELANGRDLGKGKMARPSLLSEEDRQHYLAEMEAAAARLDRFAPYFAATYPETMASQGLIESPLLSLPKLQAYYESHTGQQLQGQLLLKQDSELPISGSIKARGGIYHVLCLVEEILGRELDPEAACEEAAGAPVAASSEFTQVTANSLAAKVAASSEPAGTVLPPHRPQGQPRALRDLDYSQLNKPRFREILSKYQIVVSSTGNLGLSIGIASAKFGFKVYVYMSQDAREWKKELLREVGAEVVEVEGDYGQAVQLGRAFAASSPHTYFIDDERSEELFWGYSVAALRLKDQLEELNIQVDEDHPLFVYLPCGVGGGPGGICMGLELVFGRAAHCFFGEPVQVPCALLGFASGLLDQISTQDLGLVNETLADGLAVSRLSPLVGQRCQDLVAGCYTVLDQRDLDMLKLLWQQESIFMEPSSQVALLGPHIFQQTGAFDLYLQELGLEVNSDKITHLAWGTGGAMVPGPDREVFLAAGTAHRAFTPSY